ncbi:hypothetical protein ACWDX6_27745 [Streptomyces sp. NPDC003027]
MIPLGAAGWNAVLAIMFGRAVTHALNTVFATDFDPSGPMMIGMSLLALLALLSAWLILIRGPVSLEWVNKIVAPGLAVMAVVMLIVLTSSDAGNNLGAAAPLAAFGDARFDFAVALELSFATGFSWWSIMGDLARLTRTPRSAFWPNLIGIFLASAVAGMVGTIAALVLGEVDPTVWMVPLGGAALGVLALISSPGSGPPMGECLVICGERSHLRRPGLRGWPPQRTRRSPAPGAPGRRCVRYCRPARSRHLAKPEVA